MKKKSVVQWVASRKIRWPASTYTSIVLVFFSLLLHFNMYVCVTFSICFLGFGHALFEWVVWETKPKKSQGLWSNELRWQFYLNWNNWAWKITTIIYFTMWIQLSLQIWDWKEIFIHIYIITTNNSLQIKWHRTDFVCMNC